jgi:WhiB family redox-sensing transcriptional regulator
VPDVSVLADRPWAGGLPGLEELLERPAWQQQAACRGMDPNTFFPGVGDDQTEAKGICAGCIVREACLAFSRPQDEGIWGGHNGRDRRKLRRATRGDTAQEGRVTQLAG